MNELEHILEKSQIGKAEGVWLLTNYMPEQTHEEAYLKVREKEGRILSDEEVKQLPDLLKKHPKYKEWQLRKQISERFISFLNEDKTPVRVLDVGCGNGWFTAKMAALSHIQVVGLDLNLPELEQAQHLFGNSSAAFCYANIFEEVFKKESFDKVVLNASIQYFPSLALLFSALFRVLKPDGEIHILDSPFYQAGEVRKAKERTAAYYQSMGCPEMAAFYFHHTFQDLAAFSPIIQPKKYSFWDTIRRKPKSPFQWIVVRSQS
jgi:ubiquinone/menaquinone biosynthesis C-methylase UbiE